MVWMLLLYGMTFVHVFDVLEYIAVEFTSLAIVYPSELVEVAYHADGMRQEQAE